MGRFPGSRKGSRREASPRTVVPVPNMILRERDRGGEMATPNRLTMEKGLGYWEWRWGTSGGGRECWLLGVEKRRVIEKQLKWALDTREFIN